MTSYKNSGGDSGVSSYEIATDRIIVTFSSNVSYEYTFASAGRQNI